MSSPSSVLTLGLGNWGSAALVITIGFGGAAVADEDVRASSFVVLIGASNRFAESRGASPELLPIVGASLAMLTANGTDNRSVILPGVSPELEIIVGTDNRFSEVN